MEKPRTSSPVVKGSKSSIVSSIPLETKMSPETPPVTIFEPSLKYWTKILIILLVEFSNSLAKVHLSQD